MIVAAPPPNSPTPIKVFDVIVIGGGLSGVLVSHGLQKQQPHVDWQLLEARHTLGGRLVNDVGGRQIDMGGAWIWPNSHQPRVRQLVQDLEIPTFVQPDDPTSIRIDGGAVRLVERLTKDLPQERIQLNTAVKSCTLQQIRVHVDDDDDDDDDTPIIVQIQTNTDETLWARWVVWAVPPRILHEYDVAFDPPLSPLKQQEMAASHTWMAGVTKVALVYANRFWSLRSSNMGLPSSHLGPAFQVYDSSTKNNEVSALTFFTLVVVNQDKGDNDDDDDDAALAKQVADQMANVWNYLGEKEAAQKVHSYMEHYVQRWPQQSFISEDPQPKQIHPHPQPKAALSTEEWPDGVLQFAGSETDQLSPGLMEGAIGAAQRVLESLQEKLRKK